MKEREVQPEFVTFVCLPYKLSHMFSKNSDRPLKYLSYTIKDFISSSLKNTDNDEV